MCVHMFRTIYNEIPLTPLIALDDNVIEASALDVPQDKTTATTSTGVTLYSD